MRVHHRLRVWLRRDLGWLLSRLARLRGSAIVVRYSVDVVKVKDGLHGCVQVGESREGVRARSESARALGCVLKERPLYPMSAQAHEAPRVSARTRPRSARAKWPKVQIAGP